MNEHDEVNALDLLNPTIGMIPANVLFTVAAQYIEPSAAELTGNTPTSKFFTETFIPPVIATLGFVITGTTLNLLNNFLKSGKKTLGEFLETQDLTGLPSSSCKNFLAGTSMFSMFVLSSNLGELYNSSEFGQSHHVYEPLIAIVANVFAIVTYSICTKLLSLKTPSLDNIINLAAIFASLSLGGFVMEHFAADFQLLFGRAKDAIPYVVPFISTTAMTVAVNSPVALLKSRGMFPFKSEGENKEVVAYEKIENKTNVEVDINNTEINAPDSFAEDEDIRCRCAMM